MDHTKRLQDCTKWKAGGKAKAWLLQKGRFCNSRTNNAGSKFACSEQMWWVRHRQV